MSNDYFLLDADSLFTKTLADLMTSKNIDYDIYSKQEIDSFIRLCTQEFNHCWDDFMLWILYGDDKKSRTIGLIRARMLRIR